MKYAIIDSMLQTPFYNPEKSYEENYEKGPYGSFTNSLHYHQKGHPQHHFLGNDIYLPFGIPSGPLLNSKYIKSSLEKGFDIVVYKTVRSGHFPCHPYPNILSIKINGDLTLKKAKKKFIADKHYEEPLSITNSFGVPSQKPEIWQKDVRRALAYIDKGQLLILSFMGTVKKNQTQKQFIDDFILSAKLAVETGSKVLEANLSCPNIGNEGLVCYNLEITEKVCQGIRREIGNIPLILKVGYFQKDKDLVKLAKITNEYADSIAAINTIPATIVDKKGKQALPGEMRAKSGVCGAAIKWAGLDMVKRLKAIRDKYDHSYKIIGVGGVMNPDDYSEYRKTGADCVMSATGAMWNPRLACDIKEKILHLR